LIGELPLHSLIFCQREDAAHILGILFDRHFDLRKLIMKDCYVVDESTGMALYSELEGCLHFCCLLSHPTPEETLDPNFSDFLPVLVHQPVRPSFLREVFLY
jgi:hypothetical protein